MTELFELSAFEVEMTPEREAAELRRQVERMETEAASGCYAKARSRYMLGVLEASRARLAEMEGGLPCEKAV